MTKTTALFTQLELATERLIEAIALPETQIHRDATIQRFEFTFELAWKLMHAILADNGIEVYGPKNTFREAARLQLIDNVEIWFTFLEARNLTTHTYKEDNAKYVYRKAKEFSQLLPEFIEKARSSTIIETSNSAS
ncbi:TPA: nucleotidyltransferase [Patescibacteria group bacterium]|uniref:Nucleotidyltransferase substrate binding protein, HI0074 family n=1 Tax=Candidatus Gottesmanbacteria bacterium GW2011_GWA1_43_11 TaxID=1618436 RepID=A0A0G1CEJ8_9BACT|nr:MAG: Nucleotidyltransferase substrate binding protein, HI0074 family [Candidatus Gottesmanbacteria bacterium GW2011_GWA1_43_11]HCS78741.1 nucleotidyltransferase [Patescibacteria group bacterium]